MCGSVRAAFGNCVMRCHASTHDLPEVHNEVCRCSVLSVNYRGSCSGFNRWCGTRTPYVQVPGGDVGGAACAPRPAYALLAGVVPHVPKLTWKRIYLSTPPPLLHM